MGRRVLFKDANVHAEVGRGQFDVPYARWNSASHNLNICELTAG